MSQLMCLGLQLAETPVRVSLAILYFCVRAFVVETKLPVAFFQLGTSKL